MSTHSPTIKLLYWIGVTFLIVESADAFRIPSSSLGGNVRRASHMKRQQHDHRSMFSRVSSPAARSVAEAVTPLGYTAVGLRTSRSAGEPIALAARSDESIHSDSEGDEFYTATDLDTYSEPWGITLHYRGTLNTYRIEAHRPSGEVAGYTTGFYLGDLLHLDKVQIQRKASAYEPGAPNAPAPGTRDLPWAEKTGNLFQLGAVLGCAAVRYGFDRGAKRVELLAIRENEQQHTRLVRYYRIAGFRAERDVGEDLGSLRDRLLWGAEGTLMSAKADDFMRRWTPLMRTATQGEKQQA